MTQATQQPLHRALGLTDAEYAQIEETLERAPNDFELAVFSLLWSEHCGYKHSRLELRRLPTNGPRVLQGPGENAGVIDVGDGLAVAFKVESHNHPSAVEPYQGAATGVGGILRDIFAMGARPIALGDSLRLGPLDEERPRELFRGIVRGIGGYGNCVGVPNVAGETVFDAAYRHNPLVNALCIGLLRADELVRASATGPGNLVVLFGATTGRDGIGGASVLASQDLDESDEDKRPTVQVGDPFTGKKLIECTLELAALGLVVSVQDLGAAGLASSTSEMAASGGVGIELELDRVPLREQGMQPFEIMISESQERMAAIVEPARLAEVEAVCARWQLPCTAIGTVTDDGRLRCRLDGEVVGDMPAEALADAPRYPLHAERPEGLAERALAADEVPAIDDPARAPARPAGGAQHLRQDVGLRAVRPGRRLGNGRPARWRRGRGAPDAVRARHRRRAGRGRRARRARSAPRRRRGRRAGRTQRRLQRRRARRDHELPQLRQPRAPGHRLRAARGDHGHGGGLRGARHAGRVRQRLALQRERRPADPPDARRRLRRRAGAGRRGGARGAGRRERDRCSCSARRRRPTTAPSGRRSSRASAPGASPRSTCPRCAGSATCSASSRARACSRSAHDVSDGGLAVALAEIALACGSGLEATIDPGEDAAATLFGECCGLVVVSCAPERGGAPGPGVRRCRGATRDESAPWAAPRIALRCGELALDVPLEAARAAYEETLPRAMGAV